MSFDTNIPVCPFLPVTDEVLRATAIRECGQDRGEKFYLRAMECAQSLWRQGLPAQAILLLNRGFGADLSGAEPVLREWPLPYRALRWILENRQEEWFIGNPRRHFQHLATRMVEPRRELRSWRAWGCWWISREVLRDMPADEKQLSEEDVVEPSFQDIQSALLELGMDGEADVWRATTTTLLFRE